MAELSEELIGKLVAMAESFQDVKQQVQQAAQDSQQAVQSAKQAVETAGATQSDLVSRFLTMTDIDQGDDEQRRADQALGFGGRVFKHNVYDFGRASELLTASQQLSMHQANLNAATIKLVNGSVDQYLAGGQLNGRYNNAKWQQELRHSDIASENQWEDKVELAGDLGGLEAVKSMQVPPAVIEE